MYVYTVCIIVARVMAPLNNYRESLPYAVCAHERETDNTRRMCIPALLACLFSAYTYIYMYMRTYRELLAQFPCSRSISSPFRLRQTSKRERVVISDSCTARRALSTHRAFYILVVFFFSLIFSSAPAAALLFFICWKLVT